MIDDEFKEIKNATLRTVAHKLRDCVRLLEQNFTGTDSEEVADLHTQLTNMVTVAVWDADVEVSDHE